MAKPKSKPGRTAPSKVTINGTSSPQPTKKKASSLRQQDDFVLTISDSDEIPDDESDIDVASDEDVPASRQKEAERLPVISQEADAESRGKKRKRGAELADGVVNGNAAKSRKKDEDIDSDFEFQIGDLDDGLEELDGWGFEGAKAAMSTHKKGVDIDELISKRKAKKGVAEESDSEEEEEDDEEMEDAEDEDEEEEDMVGKLLEDEESGSEFGAEAESDEEGSEGGVKLDADSEEEEDEDEDEDAEDSDAESVLSEVAHPDDDAESASGSESESESEESRAAKAAFFAPETEQQASGLSFVQMQISRPILKALAKANFTNPTAIQSRTIPFALAGKDIVGGAVTGSGKTAAYVVPILERLVHRKRSVPTTHAVVLTPTRELAMQVQAVVEKLKAFTDVKSTVIVGGLSLKAQEAELRKRPEIVIATPGRFIDHMRNSPSFHVDGIEILVLDEADRMLEDGFADELDEILRTLPKRRQTMLFSATMTDSIEKLVRIGMRQPMRLLVDPKKSTVSTLTQEFIRIRPGREGGRLAMLVLLVKEFYKARCIVFFRSKVYAHRVRILFGLLGLKAAELHGSLSQEQRIKSVEAFRDGEVDFLLATDLASRGLDIKNVSYVINFELPQSHEIYLHRVGRTARAGRSGRAITLAAEADRKIVKKAIKAGQEHGKVVSRSLDVEKVDQLTEKLKGMEDDIEGILEDEKEEKQLLQVEMQLRKGENLIKYEDEINSRPKRTWFESEKDKKKAKEAGKAELNGISGKLLDKKKKVKLSGKMKKKLESRDEVKGDGARLFKKTKVQRQEGSKRGVKAGNMSKKGGSGAKGKSGKKFAQKLGKGRR